MQLRESKRLHVRKVEQDLPIDSSGESREAKRSRKIPENESENARTGAMIAKAEVSTALSMRSGDEAELQKIQKDKFRRDIPLVSHDTELDPKRMTFAEMILCNKGGVPMPSSVLKKMSSTKSGKGEKQSEDSAAGGGSNSSGMGSGNKQGPPSDSSGPYIAPRMHVVGGRLTIDTSSLVLTAGLEGDNALHNYNVATEDKSYTTSASFASRTPSIKWSAAETGEFYDALKVYGTDFTAIARLFPRRNRRQIKNKFKKEEKLHGAAVEMALGERKGIALADMVAMGTCDDTLDLSTIPLPPTPSTVPPTLTTLTTPLPGEGAVNTATDRARPLSLPSDRPFSHPSHHPPPSSILHAPPSHEDPSERPLGTIAQYLGATASVSGPSPYVSAAEWKVMEREREREKERDREKISALAMEEGNEKEKHVTRSTERERELSLPLSGRGSMPPLELASPLGSPTRSAQLPLGATAPSTAPSIVPATLPTAQASQMDQLTRLASQVASPFVVKAKGKKTTPRPSLQPSFSLSRKTS
jgi:hypothetical protein